MSSFKSNTNHQFRNKFSEDIFKYKYAHEGCDTWSQLADTLVQDVCGSLRPDEENLMDVEEQQELIKYISDLKFVPGGRYLYYAGRKKRFYNNCFLLGAEEDTRQDWANLSWKAESCLMTGGGIGVDYSIYRASGRILGGSGGEASGPVPNMQMIK